MFSPRVLTAALAVALLAAAPALAAGRVVARAEPLPGPLAGRAVSGFERLLPARAAPARFNLVGVHWRGSGAVWFRTARARGRWSAWREGRPEAEDGPDAGSAEGDRRRGWKLGNPYWTGTADRIQYLLSGSVSRLRAHFVWSPVRAPSSRRTRSREAIPDEPAVVTRAEWGADESIVRESPSFADHLAFAVVHHTAGATPSSPAQSAAIVRGIQTYHVRSNGWNDIGYNLLVDPFGQIFEGRAGGATRNVIGAHAQGFNTGSVGIAVLGMYESRTIAPAARAALANVLAWRLDLAHVDPVSRVTRISGGSPKWPAGAAVNLSAVSGHRDVGSTACPGSALYGELSEVAAEAGALGLPKLYDPRVDGSVGGPIRFTARLSSPLPWTLQVFDPAGAVVAAVSGSGSIVDWTWDARGAAPGPYTYSIDAGPGARPARGPVTGAPPLELTRLAVSPAALTPNGDGVGDSVSLSVGVTVPASLDAWLEDSSGNRVAAVFNDRALATGANELVWRGRALGGDAVEDGRYRMAVEVTAGPATVAEEIGLVVDRTLGHLSVRPSVFSPNGDGRRDSVAVAFTLAREATVRARVVAGSRTVATVATGRRVPGRQSLAWTGSASGLRVSDGRYRLVLDATTGLGTRALADDLKLDTRAPRVRGLSARRSGRGTLVRFGLDEPALLAVRIGRATLHLRRGAGRVTVWRRARPRNVVVVATDGAENVGRPVRTRVRR
jgi:hypothetical protein